MNVEYRLSDIKFIWDSRKAAVNRRKHNVDFKTACEVFLDPFIRYVGTDVVNNDEREAVIGMTGDWILLKVIYVYSPESIRLISARTATIPERKNYEEQ